MIEEQIEKRIVQHRGDASSWGPEYADPDKSNHKSQPHKGYGSVVASIEWSHGSDFAKLPTKLGEHSQREDERGKGS
jgi:hypothetical protein